MAYSRKASSKNAVKLVVGMVSETVGEGVPEGDEIWCFGKASRAHPPSNKSETVIPIKPIFVMEEYCSRGGQEL